MEKPKKNNQELYNKTRQFLKEKRLALGMTTADVALALHGNRRFTGSVCDIEGNRKTGLTLSALEDYLKLYNCDIEFIEK